MRVVKINYFGMPGEGRTLTEAKRDAGVKIERALSGSYDPILFRFGSHVLGVMFRSIAGWEYKMASIETLSPAGAILYGEWFESQADCERALRRHAAQWVYTATGPDGCEIIQDDGDRREHQSWVTFQMRYATLLAAGYKDDACHRLAGGDPLTTWPDGLPQPEHIPHESSDGVREAAQAATAAQAEADEAAAAAEIAAWIEAHGSPRLRRLVAEKIEHERTYQRERLTLERPGWEWLDRICGEPSSIRDASEESLAALDEARKSVPDAKLVWLRDGDHVRGCEHQTQDEEVGEAMEFVPGPALQAEFLDMTIIQRIQGQ